MLQHNISRDSTLQDEIKLIVDNNTILYRDTVNSNSDPRKFSDILNVRLQDPIKRVSKIKINNIVLPFTYNVNLTTRQYTLILNNIVKTYTVAVPAVIEPQEPGGIPPDVRALQDFADAYNNSGDLIIPDTNMELLLDVVTNKLIIQLVSLVGPLSLNSAKKPLNEQRIHNNTIDDNVVQGVILAINNLTFNMGFTELKGFKSGVISTNQLEPNGIVIDNSNNILLITAFTEFIGNPIQVEINVPNAVYDIYTLSNVLRKQNVTIEYDDITKLVILYYKFNDTGRFILQDSPLKTLLGFSPGAIDSTLLIISDRDFDIDFYFTKSYINYTALRLGLFDYVLPVGNYTVEDAISALNLQNLSGGVPEYEFSYSEINNRVKITKTAGGIISIRPSGLMTLLGLDYVTNVFGNERPVGEFIFPKAPAMQPKYYTLNSKYFNIIRETKNIKFVQGNPYNDTVIYNTVDQKINDVELFLSRKADIQNFDLYIANDIGEIVSIRTDNFVVSLTFFST